LELTDHNIFDDGGGDLGERVENLERQRVADHHVLAQIAAAIQTLEGHFGSAHERLTDAEEAIRSPYRDLQIRQEMRELKAQVEQDIVKGM
jgi:cation transport regulator ChaC